MDRAGASRLVALALCTLWTACAGEIVPERRDQGELAGDADLGLDGSQHTSDADLAGIDLRGQDQAGPAGASDLANPGLGGSGAALPAGDQTLTLQIGGTSRSVLVHVPSAPGPMPLVIALHGNGDVAGNFVAVRQLKTHAAAGPFVLAAPQGVPSMPAGLPQSVSWDAYSADGSNPDLSLLDAIKAQLGASSTVDQKRIFVWGYSQGGYMAMRYGMERSSSLSCAGVIAAVSPTGAGLITSATRAIPVAMQIGTLDYAIDTARAIRATLQANGNPLEYTEIAGAGHAPFPGSPTTTLDFCLSQSLP